MLRQVIAVTTVAVALGGCAAVVPAVPADTPSAAPVPSSSPDGRLVGRGLVLDDGSGPELCLGGVAESLPPQCGGPKLVGWSWPADAERAAGVTWVDAALLGTYDGHRFTVVRTLSNAETTRLFPAEEMPDFATPCPEPAGGWVAPDPDRATEDDQQRVFTAAERLPGYAESWLDDLGDSAQDPRKIVVNVRVTGDPATAERALRAVWGGSLCVTRADHSAAELRRIQTELMRLPGALTSGAGQAPVDLTVTYDDGSLQAELDGRYGPGLVEVASALLPYQE